MSSVVGKFVMNSRAASGSIFDSVAISSSKGNRQTCPAITLAETNKERRGGQIEAIGTRGRHVIHRRATRIALFGHPLSSCPAGLEYVRKRRGRQRRGDQIRLDLIVRTDPKPNTNQPTMHAVIAPASVASICAVEELPRTGD